MKHLIASLCLSFFFVSGVVQLYATEEGLLLNRLDQAFIKTLENAPSLPTFKDEEFAILRPQVEALWKQLLEKQCIQQEGSDGELRGPYVGLQCIVEHVLSGLMDDEVLTLVGVIHTPRPATPFCTRGEVSLELVDPNVKKDPLRSYTVKSRASIMRDYLQKGGLLYVAYPEKGFGERTASERKIYLEELANYPEHLIDFPLVCEVIPEDKIGATYVFTDRFGSAYAFSIRMTQAKDAFENQKVGLWLGSLDHAEIKERVETVANYLTNYSFKPLKLYR